MFSRENLDWMNEAPKMSFNETLGRPVFLNREAFYVCLSGLADPTIFEQVEFEIDEHFEKHYKKRTGDEKVDPQLVSQYIGNMVDDADNDYKNITPTKGVDAFVVPEDNPNTHTDKNIRWFNTEKLEKIKQKHEARVDVLATAAENSEIYSHHTDGSSLFMESTPSNEIDASLVDAALDEAKEGAKNALDEELKTLEEYDKKNLKK